MVQVYDSASSVNPPRLSVDPLAGHWQRSTGWPLAATMDKFVHVVFSKGRPGRVARIQKLVGDALFKELRWLVGHGDRVMYVQAGAHFVTETGDLCHTVQWAINMANRLKRPVTFMADDVRGFYVKMGDPRTWPTQQGQTRSLVQFASRIMVAMRQVGAPLGGVYQQSSSRTQLTMPYASYHHFCILDFIVLEPPFPVQLVCDPQVNCKVDYHLTASTLAAVGAVCRLNHFSIDAAHYQEGGCGTAPQRCKADAAAAKWLQRHWKLQSGAQVFIPNTQRTGNCQVLMRGERWLLSGCDARLPDLHKRVKEAMSPSAYESWAVLAKHLRRQSLAVGSKTGSKTRNPERSRKRKSRGTTKLGVRRKAGRLQHGATQLLEVERQRLSRARTELRKVVHELRQVSVQG